MVAKRKGVWYECGDDIEATLRKLVVERLTAATIAERLNAQFGCKLTRTAVSSKLHRLGIATNPIKRARTPTFRKRRAPVVRLVVPEPAPLGDIRGGCRWPMWGDNEKPTHFYCGNKVFSEGVSYCPHHYCRAYKPTPVQTARAA